VKRNPKKRKLSDSSNSDSVKIMTPPTTLTYGFHWVASSLATPTTTLSLMKTSLKHSKKTSHSERGNILYMIPQKSDIFLRKVNIHDVVVSY